MSEQGPETTAAAPAEDAQPTAADTSGSAPARAVEPAPRTGRINRRKMREGSVVSAAMDKTAVVAVVERVRHTRYDKTVQRTKRVLAHDEANDVRVGDRVRVAETRPLSKLKRWRIVEVLERAK